MKSIALPILVAVALVAAAPISTAQIAEPLSARAPQRIIVPPSGAMKPPTEGVIKDDRSGRGQAGGPKSFIQGEAGTKTYASAGPQATEDQGASGLGGGASGTGLAGGGLGFFPVLGIVAAGALGLVAGSSATSNAPVGTR